jgi:hypothetical protein
MGVALVAVGAVGWLFWKSQQQAVPSTPPPTLAAATPAPAPSAIPASTVAPPPVTVAPAPALEEAGGKATAQIRSAQAAFRAGSYDRAVAAAQEALRDDPANASALEVLENAQAGQRALAQLRTAEAALASGDFDAATSQLEAARRIAPWDREVAGLGSRIAEARERAKRDAEAAAQSARATQINSMLGEASGAMERKQFEAAIAAYNRVLELDPSNQVAMIGKGNALTAKTVAEAAAAGPRPGAVVHSFVAGRTEATGNEQGGLVGFEDSAGVDVKRGTSAAELPGKVVFAAVPPAPKPGERFRVSAFLSNEGAQPIQLESMEISTTTDGKPQRGSVPPATTTVAPGQKALVYQTPGEMLWREGTTSWVMEIILRTKKGETYKNTLSWR